MFAKDLIVGQCGEDKVYNFLRHKKNVKQIMDVTQAKKYQNDDIDLLVQTNDDEVYSVEIKRDTMADKTGNIPYETKSNSNVGCLERSKADYIFWVTDNHIYWHSLTSIRKYIDLTEPVLIKMGDNARGYLLPIEDLKEKGVLYEI